MNIKKVCVVGGGQMGKQIALCAAIHGFDTTINDALPKVVDSLQEYADNYLAGRLEKGKMTAEEVEAAKKNFHVDGNLETAAKDADLVIEAILENQQIKEEFFTKLNKIVRKDTIIGTNSSFMPSSMFAHLVDNPSRLANIHYFNPALVMKLVEVVKGEHTSDETCETLLQFARENEKTPIWVKKEIEGFIANRVLKQVNDEAMRLVEGGYVTPVEVDLALENGLNYPMGPFKMLDFAGIDIAYDARKRDFERTGVKAPGYDVLEQHVLAGELGRKTGKGFYDYSKK